MQRDSLQLEQTHFSTALRIACRADNLIIVKLLIGAGAEVNEPDYYEASLLFPAVKKGQANLVALLLTCGAKIDAEPSAEDTPLSCAARKGYVEIVEVLVAHLSKPEVSHPIIRFVDYLEDALNMAVLEGNNKIIEILVKKAGANINADPNNQILLGACFGGHIHTVQLLIGLGTNLNCLDAKELFKHCFFNKSLRKVLSIAKILLDAGFKIDLLILPTLFTSSLPLKMEEAKLLLFIRSYLELNKSSTTKPSLVETLLEIISLLEVENVEFKNLKAKRLLRDNSRDVAISSIWKSGLAVMRKTNDLRGKKYASKDLDCLNKPERFLPISIKTFKKLAVDSRSVLFKSSTEFRYNELIKELKQANNPVECRNLLKLHKNVFSENGDDNFYELFIEAINLSPKSENELGNEVNNNNNNNVVSKIN